MTYNTLFVKRLVVYTRAGSIAYDERFHKGINIIRGQNSSGKSTVTNFIFFVLGGEFTDFTTESKLCSVVYAETELNGATITLRRIIQLDDDGRVKTRIPISLYWGQYDDAINPPPEKAWQLYGYNSYTDIRSFSNIIFDNLDIPTVRGDNSNITIHQLLRLIYIDQESPTSSLFLYEQFDSQITRETTSELLLGIYEDELYQYRRRLIEVDKEIDNVRSEIKATKGFFSDPLLLIPANIEAKISNAQGRMSEIEEELILTRGLSSVTINIDSFRFQKLSNEIAKQRINVVRIKDIIERNNLEITDNDFFLDSLNSKLTALKNSLTTRAFLHNFPLSYCPECLTDLRQSNPVPDIKICQLCKEEIDASFAITQGRRMEQEIINQINESNSIQKKLKAELEKLVPRLRSEKSRLKTLQRQYDDHVQDVQTSKQEQIQELYTTKGFIEGEIIQYQTLLENALYFQRLETRRDEVIREKARIDAFIQTAENRQNALKTKINTQVKAEALYLLNNDLLRQDDFQNANDFHIDFANNIAFLSNKYSKYSASSNFYLKITARFAIFLAPLSIPEMRYPRFILADNMEDKGIEEKRAQNFQEKLIKRLESFDANSYQVIYTTSYITDELNESPLVVGEFYTAANRTLKNLPTLE